MKHEHEHFHSSGKIKTRRSGRTPHENLVHSDHVHDYGYSFKIGYEMHSHEHEHTSEDLDLRVDPPETIEVS